MKTRTILFILMAVSFSVFQSCSKSDDPAPIETPQYPQLIGTWTGNTSQEDTISVTVAGQGSSLIVTGYYYGIYSMPTPSEYSRVIGGQTGVSILFKTGNSFAFSIGTTAYDTLKGVFDVTGMTLSGSITSQFVGQSGHPVVTATYTATKK